MLVYSANRKLGLPLCRGFLGGPLTILWRLPVTPAEEERKGPVNGTALWSTEAGLKLTIALRAGRRRVHFLATVLWLPVPRILVLKYGW
jgi:hypothetical protein